VFQAITDGVTGSVEPTWPTSIGAQVVDGTVTWICIASNTFSGTLANPAIPLSVVLKVGGVAIGADDGAGNITGTGIVTGTINYSTGVVSVKLYPPPFGSQQVTVVYDAVVGLAQWLTKYSQISFTLSSSTYGPGGIYTLNKMTLGSAMTSAPSVLSIYSVRKLSDHSKLCNLIVVTEGLKASATWNKLTDPATSCMEVNDTDFQNLLGSYINQGSPDDVLKSADPNNISNGQRNGTGPYTYPNIYANPFFPATDGTYTGDPPFNSAYVHVESGVGIWEVDTGIKFLYGSRHLASLGTVNPPPQDNPGTVTSGLAAIATITSTPSGGNNPVPADVSNTTRYTMGTVTGGTYASPTISGDTSYVHSSTYSAGTFVSDNGRLACVWNTLQTFLDQANGGPFLNTQLAAIATLGNFQNTIDPSRWGSGSGVDPTFFTACSTYKTALQAWITYHGTATPIPSLGSRTTYVLTTWASNVTAAATFATALSSRFTDLDSVLGTDLVAGYTGKIYAACNLATNKTMGHLRTVKNLLNSMAGLYSTITKYQSAYATYP